MRTMQRRAQLVLLLAVVGAGLISSLPSAEAQGLPPAIRFFAVWAENRPGFASPHLNMTAFIDDPDGQVPLTIQSVVVTGPAGTFNVPFFYPNLEFRGQYFLDTGPTVTPLPGTYTLTVTDNQGNVSTATDPLGTVPAISPPNVTFPTTSEQMISTTTPTFEWAFVTGAANTQVSIVNLDVFATFGDTLFRSLLLPGAATQFLLPGGILTPGRRYLLRVHAFDAAGLGPANIRATTQIPFSVAGPSVTMSLNKPTFVGGDQLLLSVFYRNNGAPITVEGELWAGLPGGPAIELITVDNLPLSQTAPDASTALVQNFLLHTFTGAEPPSHYVLRFQFFDLGGPGVIAEASVPFRVGP